ncbi:MAG: hypothetical protein D4R80_05180 [Deltaproteobacteria bacterium]|nr:MAG: hypothetical protein D4R80_05180 [Deltaproteobacteria bacterium]
MAPGTPPRGVRSQDKRQSVLGSYPNFFFDIHQDNIPDFINLIESFDASETSRGRLAKYGINRSASRR